MLNRAGHIQQVANILIAHAEKCGVVLTIDTVPQRPLAMGNFKMVAHARESRHQPPPPPFDLDKACNDAMGRVQRAILVRAWVDSSEIQSAFKDARNALDDRMSRLILSANHRMWMYSLGWGDVKP